MEPTQSLDLKCWIWNKQKKKKIRELRRRMVSPVQVLDSLGGRSSLVRDVTMEPGLSEVVLLIVRAIWLMRSSTQPADSRASASWSQHSSMVSHIWLRPCGGKNNVVYNLKLPLPSWKRENEPPAEPWPLITMSRTVEMVNVCMISCGGKFFWRCSPDAWASSP